MNFLHSETRDATNFFMVQKMSDLLKFEMSFGLFFMWFEMWNCGDLKLWQLRFLGLGNEIKSLNFIWMFLR